jgi:type II secretory pathway pseudopilin PulG
MKYVVAVVVLAFAAIALPNVITARNRSAQKRTMADMRTIATAWEARATDRNTYLVGPPGGVSYDELRRVLEPKYIKHLPRDDGWGNPFILFSSDQEYSVRSIGGDHRMDPRTGPGATTDFDCDILYSNGTFVFYPEGVCNG